MFTLYYTEVILCPRTYPEETVAHVSQETCSRMCVTVYLIIAPHWIHPVVYQQSNGVMKHDIFTQWTITKQ